MSRVMVALLLALPVWAGETPATAEAAKKPVPANPLVLGADASGGLGAKLDLEKVETLGALDYTDANGHGWTGTPFWGAKLHGTWSSQAQAHNHGEASLNLGFSGQYETVSERMAHDLGLAFEFKGLTGTFDTTGGASQSRNEYLYGPQLIYRLHATRLNDWMAHYTQGLGVPPTLLVGFSRRGGRTETLALPEGVKADQLYVQARFSVPIPLSDSKAFLLSVLAQQARPMQGADRSATHYVNATLTYNHGGKVQPAASYQSGVKDGFKYDRQLLLGLLWDLTGWL